MACGGRLPAVAVTVRRYDPFGVTWGEGGGGGAMLPPPQPDATTIDSARAMLASATALCGSRFEPCRAAGTTIKNKKIPASK